MKKIYCLCAAILLLLSACALERREPAGATSADNAPAAQTPGATKKPAPRSGVGLNEISGIFKVESGHERKHTPTQIFARVGCMAFRLCA